MLVVVISTEINVKLGEFFAYFLIKQFKLFLHKLVPLLMWRYATQEKGILFDDCRLLIALNHEVGLITYVILHDGLQAFNLAAVIMIAARVLVGDVDYIFDLCKCHGRIFPSADRHTIVETHYLARLMVVRHDGLAFLFVE